MKIKPQPARAWKQSVALNYTLQFMFDKSSMATACFGFKNRAAASGSLWEDLEPSGTSEPGSFWEPPGASGRLWEPLGTGKMRATETSNRNTVLTMFTWGIYLDQLLSCWQLFDSSTVPSQLKHGITFAGWWHYYPSKWFTIRNTSNIFITFVCRVPWNLQAASWSRKPQSRKRKPKQNNLELQ